MNIFYLVERKIYSKFNMVEKYTKASVSLHEVEGYPDIIQNDPICQKKIKKMLKKAYKKNVKHTIPNNG